jgi:sulfite reductase alpha subunit-like flavoprotein
MQALELTLLVGTMTGTAQSVAQEVELTLEDEHTRVKVAPMDGLDAGVFAGGGLFLLCTSTYGQGDVPDNAKALYASLLGVRPDLARVSYGVIALGDRTYAETFCNGGRRFDAILAELGARRIGEPMLHDASAGTMPEEVATGWARDWIALARERLRRAA